MGKELLDRKNAVDGRGFCEPLRLIDKANASNQTDEKSAEGGEGLRA